ncbi:hypothetical protein [Terricaulis sp.]|uniref:hypothetical protein n=1 Tax=Terricaulis sp. TaxID=2768686 RepID=UPI003783448F
MLQRNAHGHAHQAHWAHAVVVGLHAVCCGLPALAMLAAALSGAASATSLLPESFTQFHIFMHAYEIWILAGSAALVVVGGGLELAHRRIHPHLGFPWLFAMSTGCFALNAAIIFAHQAVG